MLIEIDYDLKTVFNVVKQEIHRAAKDKKHPFRYVVLGTKENFPAMRYVVLRQVEEDFDLIFYTDYRSNKIGQIAEDPKAQLLLYHPQKKAQVIIKGVVTTHHNDDFSSLHWENVQGEGRKAYASIKAPGERIDNPHESYEWDQDLSSEHFSVLKFTPTQVEILQLRGLKHLRATYSTDDNWKGTWLVP